MLTNEGQTKKCMTRRCEGARVAVTAPPRPRPPGPQSHPDTVREVADAATECGMTTNSNRSSRPAGHDHGWPRRPRDGPLCLCALCAALGFLPRRSSPLSRARYCAGCSPASSGQMFGHEDKDKGKGKGKFKVAVALWARLPRRTRPRMWIGRA